MTAWFFKGSGPQGGTLIFSYIRRLRSFVLVKKFEFQYFFSFQKKLFFLGGGGGGGGYKEFVDIFFWGGGGHHKIGLYLGVISIHFNVFS